MRPLDDLKVTGFANVLFPDGTQLAAFNVFVEIHNDRLLHQVVAGTNDGLRAHDTQLLAFIAYVQTISGRNVYVEHGFHEGSLDEAHAALDALSGPALTSSQRDGSPPPYTIAAIAVIGNPQASVRHVAIYRHLAVQESEAISVLKTVRREYRAQLKRGTGSASPN